jgi:hypothetical protein
LYLPYCTERFSEFENTKSGLETVTKNVEKNVPREQSDKLWKDAAEAFQTPEATIKASPNDAAYVLCRQMSNVAVALIRELAPTTPAQRAPPRKKDF